MESRLQTVERERDVYRLLARRWQSRLQALVQQQKRGNDASANEGDDGEILLTGRELFGLSDMFLRGFESDDDGDGDEEDEQSARDEDETWEEASSQPMDTESTTMSPGSSKALALRPQARSVSILSDDL
jgi:hypothetical protein